MSVSITLVNGEPAHHLPVDDRAIAYGDGCFTTIAKVAGHIQLVDEHIQRLKRACLVLDLPFSDWSSLRRQIVQIGESSTDIVIKVIISRGSGGRGYSTQGATQPVTILSLHAMPTHYSAWKVGGIRLNLSSIKLAKQPVWQGTKQLNRLEQVLIKQRSRPSADDELVCDVDDMIIETSAANIFWRVEKQWFTADIDYSGVCGVMRNRIVDILSQNNMPVQVLRAHYSILNYATDIFICNSLMGLVPVREIQFGNQPISTIKNESLMALKCLIEKSILSDG